jgi:hypothetical protein
MELWLMETETKGVTKMKEIMIYATIRPSRVIA